MNTTIRQTEDVHQILKQVFGYPSFRDQQLDIIQTVLAGQDSLVIMPTGGGKSLCYQIPALASTGLTLVISPLIALMADQVQALKANGVAAEYVNSTLTAVEKRKVLEDIENDRLKLLYISPEKAVAPAFVKYIRRKPVSLVAIDEAHCISIWGNDFRPEYAKLRTLLEALPSTPVIALTATADKSTQLDIAKQLGLRSPRMFLSSFERPNITTYVEPGQRRLQKILDFLRSRRGQAGIIYALSRKSTEQLATKLREAGFRAAHFHAEIDRAEKRRVQEGFRKDDIQIVCATIAFGMGIDKSNIRWIIHYNLPKNLESYYQEIGRSGRDGSPAETLLFYSYGDINIYRRFVDESQADERFKEVQHKKLDRIWQFTQATHCRTNLVLNYFGEYRIEGCGHCDNCLQPPEGFDGTELVKTALTACREAKEKLGIYLLTDFLRASGRKEVFDLGLQHLASYGLGRHLPRTDWLHYITQMINQGLLEIDYTQGSILQLTTLSQRVLEGQLEIKLTKPQAFAERAPQVKPKRDQYADQFFQHLRAWRKQMADKEEVPAFVIFSDKVLEDIVQQRPTMLGDLMQINGIGEHKFRKYGQALMDQIQDFVQSQTILKSVKGRSHLETLRLWRDGHTPEEIAKEKGVQPDTIYGHLCVLFERGEQVDIQQYINESELQAVREAWTKSNQSEALRPILDQLPSDFPFHKVRVGMSLLQKKEERSLS